MTNERHSTRGAFARANSRGEVEILASTSALAADGMTIDPSGWDVGRFISTGAPILWAHDLRGSRPPIGRAENVRVTSRGLEMRVIFDEMDEFAKLIRDKVARGFLSAVSVSFDILEKTGTRVTRASLIETSFVPVGSDPLAVVTSRALASGNASVDALENALLSAYTDKAIVAELLTGLRERHKEFADIENKLGHERCEALARRALGGFRTSETELWDWSIFERKARA